MENAPWLFVLRGETRVPAASIDDAAVMPPARPAMLVIGLFLSACAAAPPAPSVPAALPTTSTSAAAESAWVAIEMDPAPGPTVTDEIARAVDQPPDEVVAAVFGLVHPAGNGAGVWVFRASSLTSEEALERWALNSSQPRCGSPEQSTLASRQALVIQRQFINQCQPQYLVQLDEDTAAIITDDGGYAGNGSDQPRLPYLPADEMAGVVRWLEAKLRIVELVPGGPPLVQG